MTGRHRAPRRPPPPGAAGRLLGSAVLGAVAVGAVTVLGVPAAAVPAPPPVPGLAAEGAPSPTASAPPVHTSPSTSTTAAPPPPPTPTAAVPTTTPPPSTTTPPPPPPPAPEPEPERERAGECPSVLDRTVPHVARAGNAIRAHFGLPISAVQGRAGRSNTSDHPSGHALDFMVDTATGNDLANYVLANMDRLGVSYVIWRQRLNSGSGWSRMEDRGTVTANHYDHVHLSFRRTPPANPLGC